MPKLSSPHFSSHKSRLLVLDVGTTGAKALIFDKDFNVLSRSYRPLKRRSPKHGWVEQNPNDLLAVSKELLQETAKGVSLGNCEGLAIVNQRETVILWDKESGRPIYPAIVWEDERTKRSCLTLKREYEPVVRRKTGLTINPYFSATKIHWVLNHVPQAKRLEKQKRLLTGTVDSWLLFNLAKDHPHLTDYTNASRTLLFNVKTLKWDEELLKIFAIPKSILPDPLPSTSHFGKLKEDIVGKTIPILALCGDQQASMYAAGTETGETKVTYGTGTFIMQVLGQTFSVKKPFFTSIVPKPDKTAYALEAKIDRTGEKVTPLIKKPEELKRYLKFLTREVDGYLRRLPIKPKKIIIDGGITQAKDLTLLQTLVSRMIVQQQRIFDGTALGGAMLAKEMVDQIEAKRNR